MKTILWACLLAFLMTLDWAALHDIPAGEPDLLGEYAMLALSLAVFAVIIYFRWRRRRKVVGG